MIEELVGRVFATRNAAHLAHWKATGVGSYARHIALGDFYDGLIDKVDTIVEMCQGVHGIIGNVRVPPMPTGEITEHISSEAEWIAKNRESISDDVDAINNVIDDLVGLYLTTHYKLVNLK